VKEMKWEQDTRPYSSGVILFLGKWKVGGAYYNSCRSKDDPNKYEAKCYLPGIKDTLDYYTTEDEAKKRVEEAVKHWIDKSEILKQEGKNG
jgi:hypothetical protein